MKQKSGSLWIAIDMLMLLTVLGGILAIVWLLITKL